MPVWVDAREVCKDLLNALTVVSVGVQSAPTLPK